MQDPRYQTHHPKVISETIDGETIIINLDSGHYFSLNQSGGEVWSGILQRRSLEEIVAGLAIHYRAETEVLRGGVRAFLAALQKENLISPVAELAAAPSPVAAIASGSGTRPFEAPAFQRYDDMQDLLLLDPIHDVDETGWPKTPQAAS